MGAALASRSARMPMPAKLMETSASKWVSVALSAQFLCAMLNTLYRSELTPVLCLIGFYAVQQRKRNAARTYCVFLCFSIFLDIVWLSVYGGYISHYVNVAQFENSQQVRVNSLLKCVFVSSIPLFIIKIVSVFFVYKFYLELEGERGNYSRQDLENGLSEGSSLT